MSVTHLQRTKFIVQGQVQGVGFRPFVFIQAERFSLTGQVYNSPQGVVVEVQGNASSITDFHHALEHELPPLARITSLTHSAMDTVATETEFVIGASHDGSTHSVLIGADTALCPDCKNDMISPENRRYMYPFTNCTNCGPRYSIVRHIPYDRKTTSMHCFPMCELCHEEYTNPRNRRFHAQPNACPTCGPVVWFVPMHNHTQTVSQKDTLQTLQGAAKTGATAAVAGQPTIKQTLEQTPQQMLQKTSSQELREAPRQASPETPQQPLHQPTLATTCPPHIHTQPANSIAQQLRQAATVVRNGGIIAMKGLGGFHLVCDATNEQAVALLRIRKQRPHKPFAIMVDNIGTVRQLAHVSPTAEATLTSKESPIVVCPFTTKGMQLLASGISPDTHTIGVMLPYTPLHFAFMTAYAQLLPQHATPALVMTSGNLSGEPICLGNREALRTLSAFVDGFLFHNRDIVVRVDDSVVAIAAAHEQETTPVYYRRARGYVPSPSPLSSWESLIRSTAQEGATPTPPCILGAGADLKNTLCLTKGDHAFVSQHIGDMASVGCQHFHQEVQEHLESVLQVHPELIIHDAHPQFFSSALAQELATERNIPSMPLQHHFAHGYAVLAEHQHVDPALILALDGTGYGTDGTLWGGELLAITPCTQEHARLAHCSPMPLVGGEQAITEPWRIAHALMLEHNLFAQHQPENLMHLFPWLRTEQQTCDMFPLLLEKRINCPISTSAGRLYDAVSAMLNLCLRTSYEGQAAIILDETQKQYISTSWQNTGKYTLTGSQATGEYIPVSSLSADEYIPVPELERIAHLLGLHQASDICPLLIAEEKNTPHQLNTSQLFAHLFTLRIAGEPTSLLARLFHWGFVEGLTHLAVHQARETGIYVIGLSGGCMQNITLATLLRTRLQQNNLTVLEHIALPPNDGCIAYGQASFGRHVLAKHYMEKKNNA